MAQSLQVPDKPKSGYALSLALLTILFFTWGFITCLNDVLVPYFKKVFVLTDLQSSLVQFAFFGAYFVGSLIYFLISMLYGDPINKIGYKNGILLGLFTSGLGTFLFYPAAQFVSFGFFLMALFVLALGFTLLQISANPFVSILGPPETASHRLSLAGAFNSFGTTIAPILGGIFILGDSTSTDPVVQLASVKGPYLLLTLGFVLLIILFFVAKLPSYSSNEKLEKGLGAFAFPQLTLGFFAIFCYVGAEVTVGTFLSRFASLDYVYGIGPDSKEATLFVSLYWGSLMIGRFAGSLSSFGLSQARIKQLIWAVPLLTFGVLVGILVIKDASLLEMSFNGKPFGQSLLIYTGFVAFGTLMFYLADFKPARTMFLFSIVCIVLLLLSLVLKNELALWCLISLGLYNSVMWPCIFALAITGLGKYTSQGSSLLIMMILGGALVPPLQAGFMEQIGVHYSFVVPIFCYVYLAFFGIRVKAVLKKQGVYEEKAHSGGH